MIECKHVTSVFYCLEVDQEASLDRGKIAFVNIDPIAIAMCRLCNQVFYSMSTKPVEITHDNGPASPATKIAGNKHRARAQGKAGSNAT